METIEAIIAEFDTQKHAAKDDDTATTDASAASSKGAAQEPVFLHHLSRLQQVLAHAQGDQAARISTHGVQIGPSGLSDALMPSPTVWPDSSSLNHDTSVLAQAGEPYFFNGCQP